MRNNMKNLLVLSCMTLSGAVFADTAEDLTRIEAETAVLKATAKKVEVQAQIAARQAEIDRLSAPPPTQSALPVPAAGAILPLGGIDPVILAVEVIGKKRYATLGLGNGVTTEVKVGDMLPNGMKVLSIGFNEVIVGSGKQRMRLAQGTRPSYAGGGYAPMATLPAPTLGTGMGFGNVSKGVPAR